MPQFRGAKEFRGGARNWIAINLVLQQQCRKPRWVGPLGIETDINALLERQGLPYCFGRFDRTDERAYYSLTPFKALFKRQRRARTHIRRNGFSREIMIIRGKRTPSAWALPVGRIVRAKTRRRFFDQGQNVIYSFLAEIRP
jgi:hypothetical protein